VDAQVLLPADGRECLDIVSQALKSYARRRHVSGLLTRSHRVKGAGE
jgi:hypothetical protein